MQPAFTHTPCAHRVRREVPRAELTFWQSAFVEHAPPSFAPTPWKQGMASQGVSQT
jgi:hypothetical protein